MSPCSSMEAQSHTVNMFRSFPEVLSFTLLAPRCSIVTDGMSSIYTIQLLLHNSAQNHFVGPTLQRLLESSGWVQLPPPTPQVQRILHQKNQTKAVAWFGRPSHHPPQNVCSGVFDRTDKMVDCGLNPPPDALNSVLAAS